MQMQSLIGLISFSRRFIPSFARIAAASVQATTNGVKLEWNENCHISFDVLRTALITDQVLTLPYFDLPFRLEADAYNIGVGGVVSQEKLLLLRPVAYFSKRLTAQQQK
jgi:hypothetical protein